MVVKMERWVFKSLVVQWQLLVGEAAIAIFSQTSLDEEVKAEKIFAEWDSFEELTNEIRRAFGLPYVSRILNYLYSGDI